jgi:CheY-like chemotaxis protein
MLTRVIGEDIRFEFVPDPSLWNVRMDPVQITQILTNLAANARDAIVNTGTIQLKTSNITISPVERPPYEDLPAGEYVHLAFRDSGIGMDQATIANIFEPFFTTKPKGQGTGLGLAIIFGIVQQNEGFLRVHSEPGAGTTFEIFFQRYNGPLEQEQETPSSETPMTGHETILVVEDEYALLELTRTTLAMQGYDVLTAISPHEALSICRDTTKQIALLITDVVMPDMNGKELKDRLDTMLPDLKTIFMSGYTADIVANRGILEDGVFFLQKPFAPILLQQKVREVLDMK